MSAASASASSTATGRWTTPCLAARTAGSTTRSRCCARLGCYADFTLPSAPSPAQTRIVNTIYWAKDDPARPKSHDTGVPVTANGAVAGDLLMIPGPLTLNLREWRRPLVPRLEVGELAGNCLPTRHRVTLWKRAAPRIGEDLFIKLFAHGAPEKNAGPLLADDGVLDRTLRYLADDCRRSGAQLFFVSAWHMWAAIDAIRRGARSRALRGRGAASTACARRSRIVTYPRLLESVLLPAYDRARGRRYAERRTFLEHSQWWSARARSRVPVDAS